MRSRVRNGLVTGFALTALMVAPVFAAAPPPQPKTGPGASLDATTDVVKRSVGRVSSATYVYHLAAAPAEPRAVVVLFHAWGAVNPVVYGGWIEHLARRGHLVLVPDFQQVGKTRAVDATDNAAALLKSALAELASDPQAKPDPGRVFYLGHSAGAGIAANLAATARTRELPVPKLVFAVMPGGIASDERSRGVVLADLSGIDEGTAIVTVVGDRETVAADRASRRILKEASAVPVGRKLFVRSSSDDHGFPALSATLASPASPKEGYDAGLIKVQPDPPPDPKAPRPVRPRWAADMVLTGEQTVLVGQLQRNVTDTLDYLAYWRVFDMVAAASLTGGDMAALRSDPTFLDMGRWTDGWPVRRLAAELPKAAEAAAGAPIVPAARSPSTIQSKQPVTRRRESRRAR